LPGSLFCCEGRVRVYRLSPAGREQVLASLGPGQGFNTVPPFQLEGVNHATVEEREAPDFDEEKAEVFMEGRGEVTIAQHCFRCKTGEDQAPLLPVRHKGRSLWVCTRCLPALIHG
jgi:hypothetical protein